jgi:hypothetical protein
VLKYYLQALFHKREGSGTGSVPVTDGSGSGSWRTKNMQFLRIRIPNTGCFIYILATRGRKARRKRDEKKKRGKIISSVESLFL